MFNPSTGRSSIVGAFFRRPLGLGLLLGTGLGPMASAIADPGIEAWIQFRVDEQERIEVAPYASAPAPREVRYELVVEADGASGHAVTRQGGEARIDRTPKRLSTFRLRQGGGEPIEAALTVEAGDGPPVTVTERFTRGE